MEYLTLDEIKDVELDLLVKFDMFCKKNNLRYSLTYGTLLGAIRHKDFIPWDDDVDVMMPREDYQRLFVLLEQGEKIDDDISFLTSKSEGYYYHFNKIYNNKTIAKMDNNSTVHGIWLDIFPLDNTPSSKILAKCFHVKARLLRNMIIAATTDFTDRNNKRYRIKRVLCGISKIIGIQRISDYLNKYVQRYNKKNTKLVSIVHGQYSIDADKERRLYFETEKRIFRGKFFNVSIGWDAILTGMYGNYMVIPDRDKQITHFLKAYYKE